MDEYPIASTSLSGSQVYRSMSGEYRIDASLSFDDPRTAFYLSFPRTDVLVDSGVTVVWHTGSGDIEKSLDTEDLDMFAYEAELFSFPWITSGRRHVDLSIISRSPLSPEKIALLTSYSEGGSREAITPLYASTRILSRAEWGADESYRYADSVYQKKSFAGYLQYRQSPKTQTQIDAINRDTSRRSNIEQLFPTTKKVISIRRTLDGHRLLWPIEKTEQVDRIVIHHTAENIETVDATDEVYLRDIYKYHALTRGWGDIGYNYIIGQRGVIYEGRAGGDYVVGGHTPANNEGSVGIALIGNFENIHLNTDQRQGLEEAISMVAERYGITPTAKVSILNTCKNTPDCSRVETRTITALAGHRDYNPTACPGINIYTELPGFISKLDIYRTLRKNTEPAQIDPFPEDEALNLELRPQDSSIQIESTTLQNQIQRSIRSPILKVRLSYTGETIILESATVTPPIGRIGLRRIPSKQGILVSIRPEGTNQVVIQSGNRTYTGANFSLEGEVVRIASWIRIPAWDTNRRYNDNLFRGKIMVRNDGGKLLVVNELPIEDYLKGMGEVSESIDVRKYPEKVKALIVAARSYGYYYLDKKLPLKERKFQTLLYDISDNPDESQMYKGYGYELRSPNYVSLVDATRGEVVKYQNSVIKVWYSSSPGGRTLSHKEYCENKGGMKCMDVPYLQSVDDPGTVGKVILGHGVGVSGGGATYFALQGWDYKKILQYYLKGVEISKK